jgi:hypothetical protein
MQSTYYLTNIIFPFLKLQTGGVDSVASELAHEVEQRQLLLAGER